MAVHFQKFTNQAVIVPSNDILAEVTAKLIIKAFSRILARKERILFIPSSGRTPIKTYALLAARYKTAIDWRRVTIVQMDEYWTHGLDEDAYFYSFLQKHLVAPLDIGEFISMRKEDGTGISCPEYYHDKISELGPIDFALHGIGRNGHIGFNEPGTKANSETRLVELARVTLEDNFANTDTANIPHYGVTLGLKILRAVRHTLLIASGKHKATAIQKLLNKDPVLETPACALWESSDFGVIVDRDAGSLIAEF